MSHKIKLGLTLRLPGESDDELLNNNSHANTDKERRNRIRALFVDLHAMLPNAPPQADRVTIVDETLSYIKTLEETLKDLEKKKEERFKDAKEFELADTYSSSSTSSETNNRNSNEPEEVKFRTYTSSNVVVNITGQEANFSICSTKTRDVMPAICCVFEKYKIEVLSAHISCDDNKRRFYMVQALVKKDSAQLPVAMLSAEDIYKQAAEEILKIVV